MRTDGLRLRWFLVFFGFLVGACQDEKATGSAEGVKKSDETSAESLEPEKVDFREYLVAVSVQDRAGKRKSCVGLGFRLSEESDRAYVAYLHEEESRSQSAFTNGEPGGWNQMVPVWSAKGEPALKVGTLRRKPALEFPLLEEYAEWSDDDTGGEAFLFEPGTSLTKAGDEEMQEIIDDEAGLLREELRKYQRELADLRRSGGGRRDRLQMAMESRIKKTERELGRLDSRAKGLGLIAPGSGRHETFRTEPLFVAKAVLPPTGNGEEGNSTQGCAISGGLGLIGEGRLVRRLTGKDWVDLVRPKLEKGQVWFRRNGEEWNPQVDLEWEGFAERDTLKGFVIWPYREGQVDQSEPVVFKDELSFSKVSLSALPTEKARRFRCQLELDPGTGEVVKPSFEFEVRQEGGKMIPVELVSDSLKVESKFRVRKSGLKQAQVLKELETEGEIARSVSYNGGRRLFLQLKSPAKIRILDTGEMKWLEEWELPHEEVIATTNGADLFLYDPKVGSLTRRSLQDFAVGKEFKIVGGDEVLAMGVGTEFEEGPLLLVYRTRLELRDSRTLEVIERSLKSLSDMGGNSSSSAVTEFPDVEGSWVVFADPLGKAFSVHLLNDEDDPKKEKTITVFQHRGNWVQRDERRWALVSRNRLIVEGNRFRGLFNQNQNSIPRPSHDDNVSMHAEGRGFAGLSVDRRRTVFPPPPMMVNYLPSVGEKPLNLCLGGQAAVDQLAPHSGRINPRIRGFQPFYFLPGANRMISLGRDRVVFESIPADVLPTFRVVERTPFAIRGEAYRYLPKARSGEVPAFKISEGPEGMVFDKEEGFQWKVPANFAEEFAQVKVTRTDEAGKTIFTIPVCGKRGSGFVDLSDPTKTASITPISCETFATPIYDIKPAAKGDFLLATFNESRSLRVIDMASGKTVSEMDSPGGPMEVCPYEGGVLICYLSGMIFEKRTLPHLERELTKAPRTSGRLISLVVGRAENSGMPFGVFDTGEKIFSVRELEMESLAFGPAIPIPKLWSNQHEDRRGWGWVKKAAASADGRKVWFGGYLLKQEGAGNYSYARVIQSASATDKLLTDSSGQYLFDAGRRYQAGSRQPWVPDEGRGILLVPGHGGNWMMNLKLRPRWSNKAGSQSIDFIPMLKNEPRYRLDGLAEWDVDDASEVGPRNPGNTRMLLCGSGPFIVTIAPNGQDLFIRKLPLVK